MHQGAGFTKRNKVEDFKRLVSMYQTWIHKMYPEFTIESMVEKVEKLCHSKGVKVKIAIIYHKEYLKFCKKRVSAKQVALECG
jgi:hypothetical protein